jgi:hypothetical protein
MNNESVKEMISKMTNEEYAKYMKEKEVQRKKFFDDCMQSRVAVVEDFETQKYFIADRDSNKIEDYMFFQNYFSGKNTRFYNIVKWFKTKEEAQGYVTSRV